LPGNCVILNEVKDLGRILRWFRRAEILRLRAQNDTLFMSGNRAARATVGGAVIDRAGAPRWPAVIDPTIADVSYDVPADEFLVYFGGKPVPKVCDPLDAPGFEDVAIMLGVGADDEATDEIVGVQVIPMLLGAVQEQPAWAVLAWAAMAGDYGTELLQERLPGFLAEVNEAFTRYWTPPPSMEEQMAGLTRVEKTA
jgi:hypothetical protein